MSIKPNSVTTYDIGLADIKTLLIKALELNVRDNIEVQYKINFNELSVDVVGVKVIVKPNQSILT